MLVSSLVWLRLGFAAHGHHILMVIFGAANVLAAYCLGAIFDRVRSVSFRDDLTMAYNRRFLNQAMPALLKRTAKKRRTLTITLIDCDDFKKINDENGHHMGDTVLRSISRQLIDNIRHDDYLIRWGGDEFLLVASGAEYASTHVILDRLKNELNTMSKHMKMPLSVSVGTAVFPDDAARMEDLIRIADQRMYQSKRLRKETIPYCDMEAVDCPEETIPQA